MNYGIVFSSRYGQTRKIAEFLASFLEHQPGTATRLIEAGALKGRFGPLNDVDHVIIGSPVYFDRFPRPLTHWLKSNHAELAKKGVSLFLVSMNAAGTTSASVRKDTRTLRKFIRLSRISPQFVASFAGAVSYTKYGFLTKLMMKSINRNAGGPADVSRDHEFTDWQNVEDFANAIQRFDVRSKYSVSSRLPEGPPARKRLEERMGAPLNL